MRAVVTGGAGFIGHHLVGGLLRLGHQVNVIDDFSTGKRSRLAPFGDRIAVTEGSVLDRVALDEAVASCEVIFHEAAIASVAQSLVAPRLTNDVNVNGTIEVMLAAARHGVQRVIFAGSSAVYGLSEELPSRESQRPEPTSPYGAGKLAAEHYLHSLGRLHGVGTVVLRYFNVYGPGQDPASEYAAVVPRFITAVLDGGTPTINGTGDITRDFVYIDDVVEANLLAARPSSPSALTCNVASGSRDFVYIDDVVEANLLAARPSSPSALTCNVASGSRTSLRELLQAVCVAAGHDVAPVVGPARPGDIQHSQADISLARQALGYAVNVPLREGIARTVEWYRGRADNRAESLTDRREHTT
jgi:UDP-glucose 4-epimerase